MSDVHGPNTRLIEARERRGLNRTELGQLAGVSTRTIKRLEQADQFDPGLRTLINVALALNVRLVDVVHPAWLRWRVLGDVEEPPPPPGEERVPPV